MIQPCTSNLSEGGVTKAAVLTDIVGGYAEGGLPGEGGEPTLR